ncbi:YraN family protein [Candidatus Babeliales bacterium]|nr:YraN family protein [Candidatus Babeliales bacterium]
MQDLGKLGENIISDYLIKNGFKILSKNFTTKFGEIDLIAQKDSTVAFIEVKARKKAYFPISTVVTYPKQKKIIKTSKCFIRNFNIVDNVLRFDVATVEIIDQDITAYDINYIQNAFYGK